MTEQMARPTIVDSPARMSRRTNRERPMIRWYWQQVGGTLIEEFCVVRRSPTCEVRRLDGVIVKNGPRQIVHQSEISVEGQDLIVVQAKIGRLGMSVMGQTLFSRELLLQRCKPRSVEAVALVMNDDDVLRPLLEKYGGRVEVYRVSGAR